jgi:4-hydroxy-tetrahydrodipicolinate reductase
MIIALIGYGKMGKAIGRIATTKGHTCGLIIDADNLSDFTADNLRRCDVAIEFTGPHTAPDNLRRCFDAGIPVVCGSTGWLNAWPEIEQYRANRDAGLLYASNFSIGVNLFFEINKKLAALMQPHQQYRATMEEIHHTEKKDAPSGTAITLAEQIIAAGGLQQSWIGGDGSDDPGVLPILSKRIDPAPGTHRVCYHSAIDDIEIIHTAHSREGFAGGAVLAAEFMLGKKGNYTMQQVLGF